MKAKKTSGVTTLQKKYKKVADSIRSYPAQFRNAWKAIGRIEFPEDYKKVDNVVLCGMGGSALGARMIDSLIYDRLRLPFEIFTEYHLPNYVNQKTLVISSSYSGTTEETLSCTYEAIEKGAKVFAITTGGKLGEIVGENNIPAYIIDEEDNPSKQPRMSLGYSTGAILALLTKLGFIHVLQEEVDYAVETMNFSLTDFHENSPTDKNLAKSFAQKLEGKIPVFIASEHLAGTIHAIKNQINENAKTFDLIFELPELNHHLMEGLKHPQTIKKLLVFIFIESRFYSDHVVKRYPITQDVIKKNGFEYHVFSPFSEKKLAQVFETLIFGSFLALFLSEKYKTDITSIPWVDYFKKKLAESD